VKQFLINTFKLSSGSGKKKIQHRHTQIPNIYIYIIHIYKGKKESIRKGRKKENLIVCLKFFLFGLLEFGLLFT